MNRWIRWNRLCVFVCMVLPSIASAEVLTWNFTMDEQQIKNGPESDGSTNSPGTGSGYVTYDSSTNVISYSLTWDGLVGDVTKLHIHGPADATKSNPQHILEIYGPPAVANFPTTTSATWTDSHTLETLIQPGFDPLSPEQIVQIMTDGTAYVNVHTSVFGTGEIRGNLGLPVPEPTCAWFALLPLLAFRHRMRRQ